MEHREGHRQMEALPAQRLGRADPPPHGERSPSAGASGTRVLDLDDAEALDPAISGAKAAGLARARAADLPVLPGVVVPATESRAVVDVAVRAASDGRSGKARIAAMSVQPDDGLLAELRERLSPFDAPLIVRSSSPLEADGTWSGAFSTLHGITHDDLGTAVRGCWGSAFSPGVLERAERTGTPVDELELAVLVQPELQPDLGGTARLAPDGTVRVAATNGPLSPLMAGHVEGQLATVAVDGRIESTTTTDDELLRRVAALSRRVGELLSHYLIEWAAVDGEVTLLQSTRSAPASTTGAHLNGSQAGRPPSMLGASPAGSAVPTGTSTRSDSAEGWEPSAPATEGSLRSPVALRVARLVQRFNGPLAEELVLPWAVAAVTEPAVEVAAAESGATEPGMEITQALAAARSLASQLTASIWGGSPRAAAAEAERVLRQLRGGDPAPALEIIQQLPASRPDEDREVMRLLGLVRDALMAARVIDSEAAFWRLTGAQVAQAAAGQAPPSASRLGVDRWEPFIHDVVMAGGRRHTGVAAAPGAGAGRAVVLGDAPRSAPAGRYVLVAPEPGPSLAPLLWNAAGLVTRAGSTGAHLIEFAHSIGVPTVVQCDLPALPVDDATTDANTTEPHRANIGDDAARSTSAYIPLVAVDGTRGVVSIT